jgi:uroporphyrinogen decarboxylase
LNSRERVSKAIHFQGPDRLPISHAILPSAQYHYGEALKAITDAVPEDFGWSLLPDLPPDKLPAVYKLGWNRDDFGTLWHVSEQGRCGIPMEFPIPENWENYENYRWPVFGAGVPKYRLYSGHMVGTGEYYYARGGWITFFEQMQQLHGFSATMMDLAEDRKEIYQLRDDLLRFNMDWLDRWLANEYQGLHFADDWGSQTSLLISPAKWRSFFKPVYAAMFSKVKAAGLDVWFHSDGNITKILPDLLELGVDVLNCQASLIGLEVLKPYAGKICFRTDIDRQHVLPFVSPQEVKRYIRNLFEAIGTPQGGIIACGEVIEDVPLENIAAMYEAFLEFRW